MNRTRLDYWIDFGLLISFLIVTITGIIKFPGWGLYGTLGFNNISKFHDWGGIAMAILVLIHLVLHWGWIVSQTKGLFRKEEIEEN